MEEVMAYVEGLAQRVMEVLSEQSGLVDKKMFGGVGYMVHGNMACGVNGDALIVRVGPDRYQEALAQPHVKPFDMTGRPMKGWVVVSAEGCQRDEALEAWIQRGVDFALTLEPK
jgi:TfoX/Sxy family transcriptional regulator of competence genes